MRHAATRVLSRPSSNRARSAAPIQTVAAAAATVAKGSSGYTHRGNWDGTFVVNQL